MNEQINEYLGKYPDEIITLFTAIRQLIMETEPVPDEKLWAKLPSYYVGEKFVRLIPFKDHINIEAKAVSQFADELEGYKITPKGMLQIYLRDTIPFEALRKIFSSSLI